MNPPSGKAVQASTVASHVWTALTFGKPVHLRLLFTQREMTPPNENEWAKIEEAAATRRMDPSGDDYKAKEVLCGVLGPENVNMEFNEKSEESKNLEKYWYGHIRIWENFRRIRFP